MKNPDKAQNEKLGREYFDEMTKTGEEPPVTQDDIQNEILKQEDTPAARIITGALGMVICLFVLLMLTTVVIAAFRWALGL